MIAEIVLFVIVFILTYAITKRGFQSGKYPPGPLGLPIVGYVPFLGIAPHKTFVQLAKKYGDIFSVNLGMTSYVVIGKVDQIKEACKRPEFQGRPILDFHRIWAGAGTDQLHGIVFNDGEGWAEQRRFTVRHLRNFGFGKSSMEDLILHEVTLLLNSLKTKISQPVEVSELFSIAVVNSIWTLISGKSFSHDDPFLSDLVVELEKNVAEVNPAVIYFERFAKMFPNMLGRTRLTTAVEKLRKLCTEEAASHKIDFDPDNPPRDFTDAYLKEMKDANNNSSSFYGKKGDMSLVTTMMDLFGAGFETTSTALTWSCLYLAYYPKVQAKVQKELDDVSGRERLPNASDKLVYLEATIQEVLRSSGMVPLMVHHRVTEDTEFHGYRLPKDTNIMFNSYQATRDPSYWDEPEEFSPERFVGPDGNFKSNEAFLMFGSGRRVCIGEGFARLEAKLFLGSILQKFNLALEPGPKPSLEPRSPGITIHPNEFRLVITERT